MLKDIAKIDSPDRNVLPEDKVAEFQDFIRFYSSIHKDFQDSYNPDLAKALERLHVYLVRHYMRDDREIFEKAFMLMQVLIREVMLETREDWLVEPTAHGSRYFQKIEDEG